MKKISRRSFLLAAGVAATAGVLSACGASSTASTASAASQASSSASTASSEPVTITIWSTRPEDTEPTSTHGRLVAWAKSYNETNKDNIHVDVVGSKKDDDITTAIAAGTTPDVFMGYWNTTSTWAANGALMDLTDYVNNDTEFNKDDFANVGWEQATYDDKIWGVPFIMNTTLLYYRKDLLKEGGYDAPPTTFAELKEMAIKLTKKDSSGNFTQVGFIPNYPWLDNVCWPVMGGAKWDDGNGKITFDSDAMKQSYQWQVDICTELGYDKLQAFKDGFGTRDTAEDPLILGKVAMMFFSEMKLPAMAELGANIEWGVCALPHNEQDTATANEMMLTTNQFKMNANTEHPDEAWKVMANLCGKENMISFGEGLYKNGAFYARKSEVESVKSLPNISSEMVQVADLMLSGTGRGFPNSAYVNEYLTSINDQMSLALSGDQSVDDACAAVVAEVQPLADAAK